MIFDGFGRRAKVETEEAWEQWFEYVYQIIWGEEFDSDGESPKTKAIRTATDDEDDEDTL